MNYKETELPEASEIFSKIKDIDTYDKSQLVVVKKWVLDKMDVIRGVISQFILALDFKEDPDIYQARLLKYHYLNAGMMGLIEGLYRRAVYLHYKDLTEGSRTVQTNNKAKLTAGDREVYAKGEAAGLEALRKELEETQRNLWERIQVCRTSRR